VRLIISINRQLNYIAREMVACKHGTIIRSYPFKMRLTQA